MKKTLLNILLAGSLAFGTADKSKAQEFFDSDFINNDSDDFPEEVFGVYEENEDKKEIIYYSDKDDDNFHENIKNLSIKIDSNVKGRYFPYIFVIQELYVSKSSEFIDISIKKYGLNRQSEKALSKMSHEENVKGYKQILKKGTLLQPYSNNSWKALTEQNLYELFGSPFGDKIRRRINGSQSKTKLMEVLKEGFFTD